MSGRARSRSRSTAPTPTSPALARSSMSGPERGGWMRAQVAAVRAKVAGLRPVSVFVYDSGEAAPFTAPGLAMPSALIRLGGGTDIFAGLRRSWTSVSWEQVVARKPQCVIINDYGTP